MSKKTGYFTYLWTIPWDILTWLMVLFIWVFWGTKLHWLNGLWCELKPNSWPTQTWYRVKNKKGAHVLNPVELQPVYGRWVTWDGTSFGHGGFYGPGRTGGEGIDTDVEFHEHIHTEQTEVAMLFMFITQLVDIASDLTYGQEPFWWMKLAMWTAGGLLGYACSMFTAWVRGEEFYMGNIYEESAYAQTTLYKDDERR